MIKRLSIFPGTIIFIIFFVFIAIVFPGKGPDNQIEILFGAATFVFGIISAFFISISISRLQELSSLLNSENANLIIIYKLSKLFSDEVQEKILHLLDEYLISQIDYFLQDFHLTRKNYDNLTTYLINLKTNSKNQEEAYGSYIDILKDSSINRMKIISLTKQGTTKYEWLMLTLLATITLFALFYLNDGSVISSIFTILISTAIVSIMFILRDLSSLRWKEQKWIWNNLDETFISIGLVPYYPTAVIKQKRANLKSGHKVRLVTYSHPYPHISEKRIKEVQL